MINLDDLNAENLVRLYDLDLFELGEMADSIRRQKHDNKALIFANFAHLAHIARIQTLMR